VIKSYLVKSIQSIDENVQSIDENVQLIESSLDDENQNLASEI
jgi:hypothetical protein